MNMRGDRVAPVLWVGQIKSGWRWVVGRVSGENRGKSRSGQTGCLVLCATTTILGDQDHVYMQYQTCFTLNCPITQNITKPVLPFMTGEMIKSEHSN